ncbi:MAG: RNA polymerase sigma factor RpoD/SigA [Pseudomonadota bacterium]
MEALATETDDKDLERLFAEARRYPLLTSEQEKEIDGRKWDAVGELQKLMLDDEAGVEFFFQWAANCNHTALDISYFENREHHFILRRELATYMPGASHAEAVNNFCKALQRKRTTKYRLEQLADLEMPASLTVGLAILFLRQNGIALADSVADALVQWSVHWSKSERSSSATRTAEESVIPGKWSTAKVAVGRTTRQSMIAQLDLYADARDTLTMHNLRLVYSIAGRYRGKGVNYLDLVQEGTLGLIRAAEKYDYRKGFRFSTYCFNWITQAIRRHVGDTGGLIRYPTHVQEQVSKLYRIRLNEQQRTGEEPGDAALANAAGISLEKTRDLLQLRNLGISLDTPQYEDEDTTLLDTMSGGPFAASERRAETDSLQSRLLLEMETLDRAEREVVVARWGLHDGPPLSRAEIADKLSVSREWVRQLERAALAKLSRNERIQDVFSDYMTSSVD